MGKRSNSGIISGGAIGQKFISQLPDWQLKYIDNPDHTLMGAFGTKQAQIAFMKNNGISDSAIDEMNILLTAHGGTSKQQGIADPAIVSHLQSNDEVGQALKMQIDMEEALYLRWISTHPNVDTRVYRKGERKSGVEPWTSNPDGTDMGGGHIGVDHTSTVSALMREGYHILGGFGRSFGSPGEDEITFVKY